MIHGPAIPPRLFAYCMLHQWPSSFDFCMISMHCMILSRLILTSTRPGWVYGTTFYSPSSSSFLICDVVRSYTISSSSSPSGRRSTMALSMSEDANLVKTHSHSQSNSVQNRSRLRSHGSVPNLQRQRILLKDLRLLDLGRDAFYATQRECRTHHNGDHLPSHRLD